MNPERARQLTELTADNGAFSKEIPGLQTAWDSTSLGLLKECPRKYYFSMIEGWGREGNVHLVFGQYLHSALEFYDKRRAEGATHREAEEDTLVYTLEMTGTRQHRYICNGCESEWDEGVEICQQCGSPTTKGKLVFVPWASDDQNKNRFTLVRSVMWYLEHFKDDPAETVILANGKAAVELSFQLDTQITAPDGEPYTLCGHMDRVVKWNNAVYILDRKTTKSTITDRFFQGFNPDNQMSLYTFAGQVVFGVPAQGVIIDGLQTAVTFTRFQRGLTLRTKSQLEEWFADTITWLRLNEQFALAGHWPANDKSCGNYGGCPFREICARDPKVRSSFLKSGFDRRKWDPTEAR